MYPCVILIIMLYVLSCIEEAIRQLTCIKDSLFFNHTSQIMILKSFIIPVFINVCNIVDHGLFLFHMFIHLFMCKINQSYFFVYTWLYVLLKHKQKHKYHCSWYVRRYIMYEEYYSTTTSDLILTKEGLLNKSYTHMTRIQAHLHNLEFRIKILYCKIYF